MQYRPNINEQRDFKNLCAIEVGFHTFFWLAGRPKSICSQKWKKILSQRKNTCKRCRRRIKDIESKWTLKHQNSFSESQILKTSSRVEMRAPVVILAWRKYELHNFAMRSTYVLLWFPYVNRVSLNIYEHMQHYIHPIWTPISLVTSSSNDMNAVMWCL